MLEHTGSDVGGGGLIEYMMKQGINEGHYEKQFKKLVNEIRKTGKNNRLEMLMSLDSTYDSGYFDDSQTQNHTASIFSVTSPTALPKNSSRRNSNLRNHNIERRLNGGASVPPKHMTMDLSQVNTLHN